MLCTHPIIIYLIEVIREFFFLNNTVTECLDGFYNTQCSGVCGACVNGDVCEEVRGHCKNGCMQNYQEPLCQGIYLH